jgi:hypothetical protein
MADEGLEAIGSAPAARSRRTALAGKPACRVLPNPDQTLRQYVADNAAASPLSSNRRDLIAER